MASVKLGNQPPKAKGATRKVASEPEAALAGARMGPMEEPQVRLCRYCKAVHVLYPRTDLAPCRCGNVLTWDWASYRALTRSIIDDLNEIDQILREAAHSGTTSSVDPGS